MLKYFKIYKPEASLGKLLYSSKPFRRFSSCGNQFKCAAVNKNYQTLRKYLEDNIEDIAFFSNRAGANYLSCVLENSLNLRLGSPEFYAKLAVRLLRKDIDDPLVLLNLSKAIKANGDLMGKSKEAILFKEKIGHLLRDKEFLFRRGELEEIDQIKSEDPNASEKPNSFIKYDKDSLLRKLGIKSLFDTEKYTLELKELDLSERRAVFYRPIQDQTITLLGCDYQPRTNLQEIVNQIRNKSNPFDLLIIEDNPMPKVNVMENQEGLEEETIKERLEHFEKETLQEEKLDVLQEEALETYIKSFINNDLFVLNPEEELIYQKFTSLLYLKSELGSIALHYIMNSKTRPKVHLVELPLNTNLAYLCVNNDLDETKDLMKMFKNVNILERAAFAKAYQNKGCENCGGGSLDLLPRDCFSVLFGDPLYSFTEKLSYTSNKIFKIMNQEPERKNILAVVGSYFLPKMVEALLEINHADRLHQNQTPYNFKKWEENFQELFDSPTTNKAELLEKAAILEAVHRSVESVFLLIHNLQEVDLKKFGELVEESLRNFSFDVQGLSETYEEEEKCIPSSLIYDKIEDDQNGEAVRNDYFKTKEYMKHFSGADEQLTKIKSIFKELFEKCRKRPKEHSEMPRVKTEGRKIKLKAKKV